LKKLIITAIITATSLTAIVTPQAQAQSDQIALKLCQYISVDNKNRMRSFLKSNKLKIRRIFSSVQCNGQNLLEFAAVNNAVKTGALIINKLPKSVVSKNMAVLQQGDESLANAATSRVSD
jgi:3-deoxy-D-manno-octulosonic-acid transferase